MRYKISLGLGTAPDRTVKIMESIHSSINEPLYFGCTTEVWQKYYMNDEGNTEDRLDLQQNRYFDSKEKAFAAVSDIVRKYGIKEEELYTVHLARVKD